jgi:stage III sporulation protein AH
LKREVGRMVFSGREMLKLVLFVVLIGLVVTYVASNREHLIRNLTGQTTVAPVDGAEVDLGDAEVIPVTSLTGGTPPVDGQALGEGADPTAGGGQDLFIEFRLQRDQARSEQLDLLREVLNNENLGSAAKDQAMGVWLRITQDLGREVDMENLIRAKGFADAVVVLREGQATIMVKAASLTPEEVLRLADIAARIAGIRFEDITVLARGG